MHIQLYDALPPQAAAIRRTVFMEEQGFRDEFDEIDARASHLVLYDRDTPAATGRFYRQPGGDTYIVGRIAVLQPYRGRRLGAAILRTAEQAVRRRQGRRIALHAQVQARPFYEKQGYTAYGPIELEEHCPHIWMCKDLTAGPDDRLT